MERTAGEVAFPLLLRKDAVPFQDIEDSGFTFELIQVGFIGSRHGVSSYSGFVSLRIDSAVTS